MIISGSANSLGSTNKLENDGIAESPDCHRGMVGESVTQLVKFDNGELPLCQASGSNLSIQPSFSERTVLVRIQWLFKSWTWQLELPRTSGGHA